MINFQIIKNVKIIHLKKCLCKFISWLIFLVCHQSGAAPAPALTGFATLLETSGLPFFPQQWGCLFSSLQLAEFLVLTDCLLCPTSWIWWRQRTATCRPAASHLRTGDRTGTMGGHPPHKLFQFTSNHYRVIGISPTTHTLSLHQ